MIDRAAGAKQIFNAFVIRDVGRYGGGAQCGRYRIEALGVAGSYDDVGPFTPRQFGGRQTDTGRAPDNDDLLACKHHDVSSMLCF